MLPRTDSYKQELQERELSIFRAIVISSRSCLGDSEILQWRAGPDPPDIICLTSQGKGIGVELGEWLVEKQEHSLPWTTLKKDLLKVIGPRGTHPCKNIWYLSLETLGVRPAKKDLTQFKEECLLWIEEADKNSDVSLDPATVRIKQRNPKVRSYRLNVPIPLKFEILSKYIAWIDIGLRTTQRYAGEKPSIDIQFYNSDYPTKDEAVRSLWKLLSKKITRYSDLRFREIQEIYLVLYHTGSIDHDTRDSGLIEDITELAHQRLRKFHGVFDRIFLFYNSYGKLFEIYPRKKEMPSGWAPRIKRGTPKR